MKMHLHLSVAYVACSGAPPAQMLDDGRVTDSQGRVVSFRNSIVILTSNIGA